MYTRYIYICVRVYHSSNAVAVNSLSLLLLVAVVVVVAAAALIAVYLTQLYAPGMMHCCHTVCIIPWYIYIHIVMPGILLHAVYRYILS